MTIAELAPPAPSLFQPKGASSPAYWAASIAADPEPGLLSRLMQKLLCQHATLATLRYHVETGTAQLEFVFIAEASRASLLVRQWQGLVSVQSVRYCQALVAQSARKPCAVRPHPHITPDRPPTRSSP